MIELPRGLKLLTRLVRWATVLGAVLFLAYPPFFWSNLDLVRQAAPAITGLQPAQMLIDDKARWLAACASIPNTAVSVFALWQLWQLFGQYGRGQCFAPGAQVHLRRFAWALLAASILPLLETPLLALIFTAGMPPGQHRLQLGISSDVFLPIVASAVFLAISVVLSEASRIAQEHGQFV